MDVFDMNDIPALEWTNIEDEDLVRVCDCLDQILSILATCKVSWFDLMAQMERVYDESVVNDALKMGVRMGLIGKQVSECP